MRDALTLLRRYDREVIQFYEILAQEEKRRSIEEDLRLANIIAIASIAGTKQGNRQYADWQRKKIKEIEDMQAEEAGTMTVFEKLKKNQQSNTLFTRLKYMAENKRGI